MNLTKSGRSRRFLPIVSNKMAKSCIFWSGKAGMNQQFATNTHFSQRTTESQTCFQQWESEDNLCGCQELLEEYHLANPVPLLIEQTTTKHSSSPQKHKDSLTSPKAKRKRTKQKQDEEEEELFEVSEVLGVKITQGEYHYFVHWKGYSVKENSWVPLSRFRDKKGIERFHSRAMLEWNFPKRGEISVLVGGPPCQGVCVNNRFRNFAHPLEDKKNVMMAVFLDYVKYFHPDIVLFENVPGILSLSDGYLLRFLIASFISMGYQVKQGILQAAYYGVPQRRWRVLIWAARKGVHMPVFPSPTHCGHIQVPQIIGRQYNPFAPHTHLFLQLFSHVLAGCSCSPKAVICFHQCPCMMLFLTCLCPSWKDRMMNPCCNTFHLHKTSSKSTSAVAAAVKRKQKTAMNLQ